MLDRENISSVKLFLFDMDGTLYLGEQLFPFTKELLSTIKSQGNNYLFMTNNSSKSVADYVKKMHRLGIQCDENDFITSAQATVYYLNKNNPGAVLYVGGTNSLKEELSNAGYKITENLDEVQAIVLGFDTELTFKKLDDICKILSEKDIPFYATNPDLSCPTEYGFVPDCGSVSQMIYNATKKSPVFIGKPSPLMAQLAVKHLNTDIKDAAVVGDRLNTDIQCGINSGAKSILVLSGETTKEDLINSNVKPDVVLNDCGELLNILKTQ